MTPTDAQIEKAARAIDPKAFEEPFREFLGHRRTRARLQARAALSAVIPDVIEAWQTD